MQIQSFHTGDNNRLTYFLAKPFRLLAERVVSITKSCSDLLLVAKRAALGESPAIHMGYLPLISLVKVCRNVNRLKKGIYLTFQ